MDKRSVQEKTLRKLMAMNPPKWGNSHTEEDNLLKGLPKHMRGTKLVQNAIDELYKMEFLNKTKKTGEWHTSLNPRKKEEIYKFLDLPPEEK